MLSVWSYWKRQQYQYHRELHAFERRAYNDDFRHSDTNYGHQYDYFILQLGPIDRRLFSVFVYLDRTGRAAHEWHFAD